MAEDTLNRVGSQMPWHRLLVFLSWARLLDRQTVRADFFAGLTGAIIVLPQGVAYALIAGLPPEYGLYSAIVPAIIAALFGSSWHLISGPTAALSIVVFTTISPLAEPGSAAFIQLALTLTLFAGLFQLALGLARMGTLVNFVSHSVVIGFTAGAAVIIATSQMKNVLGIDLPAGSSFIDTWSALFRHLPETNPYVLGVALATLVTSLLFKKFLPRWPGMLFAMIIGSLLAFWLDAEAHGIGLVGSIPAQLPPLSMPEVSIEAIRQLGPGAMAIGLLGLVEAVSIARAVATRSRQTIDGNQEFMGQALSNIGGAFFSCYASSGSFTRTGVNYEAGARTPLAAIFAAVSLAVIVLLFSSLTAYVPIPSMAGILLVVAYNLIDFHHIKVIIRSGKAESLVLGATFAATLLMAMEFAVYCGVLLSLVIYLKRTSKPQIVTLAPDPASDRRELTNIRRKPLEVCPQLRIVRIDGSLFFGAVNSVQESLSKIAEPHVLVICNGINFIDLAGAEMLVHEARRRQALGGGLYFCSMKARAFEIFQRGDHLQQIGEGAFFDSKRDALQGIYGSLDRRVCDTCEAKVFQECQTGQPTRLS